MMRNSSFEILRLVSMFFIVLYHILFFIIAEVDNTIIYKAMWIPLHVGVICFVLISGYFHINPSLRGIVKLIAPLIVFYIPLTVFEYIHGTGNLKDFLFFSKSPYWFIRTYLCLFLIAPVLNAYLKSNRRRFYLLIVLGFISIYMGLLHEQSLMTGKNLVLFMFLYVLGDSLNAIRQVYEKRDIKYILIVYFLFNVALVSSYTLFNGTIIGKIIWALSYPYNSPLLILNAVILFVLFSKINFKSVVINWFAASVFAVYIIHHQHFILYSVIKPMVMWVYSLSDTPAVILLYLSVLTLAIMLAFILIDKILSPLWKYLSFLANRIEERLDKFEVKS